MNEFAAPELFGYQVDWGNFPTWLAAVVTTLGVVVGGSRYLWNKNVEKRAQADKIVFASYLVPVDGASNTDPDGWAESASQEIQIVNASEHFISELSIMIRTSSLNKGEELQEILKEEHGEWMLVQAAFKHRYGPQDYHLEAPRTWPSRLAPTEHVRLQIAQTVTLLPGDTKLGFKDRHGQRWTRIDNGRAKRERLDND